MSVGLRVHVRAMPDAGESAARVGVQRRHPVRQWLLRRRRVLQRGVRWRVHGVHRRRDRRRPGRDVRSRPRRRGPAGRLRPGTSICGADGACDGQGACREFAPSGTPCGATLCQKDEVQGQLCDGAGSCAEAKAACAPYRCSADVCGTSCSSDAECAPDAACSGGLCAGTRALGEVCASDAQCKRGYCTDGVCCDTRCAGQCAACAEPGSVGTCKTVGGTPRAGRAACGGTGECAGACDGQHADACHMPGAEPRAATRQDAAARTARAYRATTCAPMTAPAAALRTARATS